MTVATANKTVMGLIGEDDFHSYEDNLILYYGIAQRQIATTVCPIIKSCRLECGSRPLPPDLYRIKSVSATYTREGNTITVNGKGTYTLTYYAYPSEPSDADSEFDIDPEAQSALPFYAAAQAVIADSDMRRYNAFMDSYNNILANIAANDKHATSKVVTL